MSGIHWMDEKTRLAAWSAQVGPKGAVITIKIAATPEDIAWIARQCGEMDAAQRRDAAPKRRRSAAPLLLEDRRGEEMDHG